MKARLLRIIIGGVLFITALILQSEIYWLNFSLYMAAFLIAGYDVVLRAGRNILRGRIFDENFLMSVATIGAFIIGEFPEGAAVMLFYQTGELFQSYAVGKSRRSIKKLLEIRPDYANLKRGDEVIRVSPDEVQIGEEIIVRAGERVPLDGIIIAGRTSVDMSALSGESLPKDLDIDSQILSGSINLSGVITVSVTKTAGESTVSKILSLVENATVLKSKSEKFITKFAKYYTPAVFAAAILIALLPPLLIDGATFSDWIYRSLAFLVVSCPCALVISVPMSFFGGIGRASKEGILIKGGNYLEALALAEVVVFDKTGTLTKGTFKVRGVFPAEGVDEIELLKAAAYAESYSNHPIAASIKHTYPFEIDSSLIDDVKEMAGFGVSAMVEGARVYVGNAELIKNAGASPSLPPLLGTAVYVARENEYLGCVLIADEIKEDAVYAVEQLKNQGIKKMVMLSGDTRTIAEETASDIGISEVYAPLLPAEKLAKVEELLKTKTAKGKLVFAGDGINDAPSLARADIGVAMGALGSDAAIDIADIVIMTDEPSKIARAIGISRKTLTIAWQNIIFAIGVKVAVLILSAFGIASMWMAVFADVGVACLAVLNAFRALAR